MSGLLNLIILFFSLIITAPLLIHYYSRFLRSFLYGRYSRDQQPRGHLHSSTCYITTIFFPYRIQCDNSNEYMLPGPGWQDSSHRNCISLDADYSVIVSFVVKDIDGRVAWNNKITSHITYRYQYMYLHWNPNVCHGNKLLNNIIAVMVITTHSVVVSLLFRSSHRPSSNEWKRKEGYR